MKTTKHSPAGSNSQELSHVHTHNLIRRERGECFRKHITSSTAHGDPPQVLSAGKFYPSKVELMIITLVPLNPCWPLPNPSAFGDNLLVLCIFQCLFSFTIAVCACVCIYLYLLTRNLFFKLYLVSVWG